MCRGPATRQAARDFRLPSSAAADEQACAERILSTLAHRAYRRPVSGRGHVAADRALSAGRAGRRLRSGRQAGAAEDPGVARFRLPRRIDPAGAAPGSVNRITDLELASRLSFFLWSSIPDDELLAVAESGELSDKSVMAAQVRRMLADPRSSALVKNFIGQWLYLRNIERILPDPAHSRTSTRTCVRRLRRRRSS